MNDNVRCHSTTDCASGLGGEDGKEAIMNNRPIKFRAWDKLQNKMIKPIPFSEEIAIQLGGVVGLFNGKTYDTVTGEFEIMQYAGLFDKNKKEIYEGDILGLDDPDDDSKCVVIFQDGAFKRSAVPFIKRGRDYHESDYIHNFDKLDSVIWKVIGNIYENENIIKP